MSPRVRTLVALFDAAAMTVFAAVATGGRFNLVSADIELWGSAVAAILAVVAVARGGPDWFPWVAIGYILFAALRDVPHVNFVPFALAIALMPSLPRPRGSLPLGLILAVVSALVARALVSSVLR